MRFTPMHRSRPAFMETHQIPPNDPLRPLESLTKVIPDPAFNSTLVLPPVSVPVDFSCIFSGPLHDKHCPTRVASVPLPPRH